MDMNMHSERGRPQWSLVESGVNPEIFTRRQGDNGYTKGRGELKDVGD